MKRERQELESKVDFVSGLNEVTALIQTDPYPHEDTSRDFWYGEVKVSAESSMTINAEDEESKINLNMAEEVLLSSFFKVFEEDIGSLKGSRKDYVKGIMKLRSYKQLESLEELLLMEGFEAGDLEVLRPYVSVYSYSPLINLNTASSLVLNALIKSLPGDHGAKQIFITRLEEACTRGRENNPKAKGCFFLNDDLMPGLFGESLKLPKTPQMFAIKERFLASITTDSETFSIHMKTKAGKEAWGIFRSREGILRPEVLWWHEE